MMNLGDKILKLLIEPRYGYKGIPVSALGLPALGPYKKQSFYNEIYRLKKKGYILSGEDKARISNLGRKYIERKIDSLPNFNFNFDKDSPKNLIIMYDIPEDKKAEREWLRFHLRKFGYEMIHKSVWVGPSPLPPEFVAYVRKLNLGDDIKALKLAKDYKRGKFDF